MIDNTMPERIYAGAWPGYWYPTAQPLTTQYIRADVAQAQLDAANKRIAELEGNLSALHYDCNLYHEMTQQQLKGIHKLQTHIIERDARIAELEAAQVPRLVTEDMHTTPFYQRDWRGRVLAYDVINKAWYEVVWEDEISEGRSRGLSHWMPLPPPPVTDVTP